MQRPRRAGGYALVGPSARTWRTDPGTGHLLEPVSEAEHRTLRHLLGAETVTTAEPAWTNTPDGHDIVSAVIPPADEPDTDERDYWADNHGWTGPFDDDHVDVPAAELGLTGGEGPPIDAGPALSADEAAHELAADGRPSTRPGRRSAATSTTSQSRSGRLFTSGAWIRPTSPRCAPTRSSAPSAAVAVLAAASDDAEPSAASAADGRADAVDADDEDGWSR